MKSIGVCVLTGIVMLGAMVSWASAQKAPMSDYKAQLEAALGGKIIAVQRNSVYPATSLTQAVNLTVARPDGRTDVVPVQIVFVKSGGGYAAESMYVLNTSAAMAARRAAQLPVPGPGGGSGGGGGGGTGTTAPTMSKADQCKAKCFPAASEAPLDLVKAAACYMACMLGLPIPIK
jgi:hypothetical protein